MKKWIIPLLLCAFCIGCHSSEKKVFDIADKVWLIDENVMGTIIEIKEQSGCCAQTEFLYIVAVHKNDFNGSIVHKKRAKEMRKFIEDPR
jgi:hypothetical protein|tara:strand:- start:320 stop:589 length:270 start_codon:yes stop_codon:yes gene_type:complete